MSSFVIFAAILVLFNSAMARNYSPLTNPLTCSQADMNAIKAASANLKNYVLCQSAPISMACELMDFAGGQVQGTVREVVVNQIAKTTSRAAFINEYNNLFSKDVAQKTGEIARSAKWEYYDDIAKRLFLRE